MVVRRVSADASVIDIRGEVNAPADNAFTDAYSQASSDKVRAIILNFSGLEYMNSSGIGLLVTLLIRANRNGQSLIAVGLNEHYQHIFELTRLNEAIRVFETEEEALAGLDS
jgi:anti-sigma B factor antagonist